MKNTKLFTLIIITLLLVSCTTNTHVDTFKEENERLKDENLQLQTELGKTISTLDYEVTRSENALKELEDRTALILENLELKNQLKEYQELEEKYPIVKDIEVELVDKYIFIDGGYVPVIKPTYQFHYLDETYISFESIEELFGYDTDELWSYHEIKGIPDEYKYVIRTEGKLYLEPYLSELKAQFDVNGDYKDIQTELDGLTIVYGEPGLREYIITKPTYMTHRGITVGSTRKEVQRQYGHLGYDDDEKWYTVNGNVEWSER